MIEEIRRLKGEENSNKTLDDYNLTVQEAIKLLKSNNIPVVLTEADKHIIDRPREYEEKGLNSLILVHKTRYMPNGSVIKSPKDVGASEPANVTIEGKSYDYAYKRANNECSTNGYIYLWKCEINTKYLDIMSKRRNRRDK